METAVLSQSSQHPPDIRKSLQESLAEAEKIGAGKVQCEDPTRPPRQLLQYLVR